MSDSKTAPQRTRHDGSGTASGATGRMMALMEGYAQVGAAFGPPPARRLPRLICDNTRPGSVFTSVPAVPRPAAARRLFGLVAALQALGRRWRREHAMARAAEQLAGMDDYALRDLGIRRSEIARVVRYGVDDCRRVPGR